jgi:hypothetical protein
LDLKLRISAPVLPEDGRFLLPSSKHLGARFGGAGAEIAITVIVDARGFSLSSLGGEGRGEEAVFNNVFHLLFNSLCSNLAAGSRRQMETPHVVSYQARQ